MLCIVGGEFDDDDLYISDSDAMDTDKPNASPTIKRPSPQTQRSATPQPPSSATNARKRRTDINTNNSTQSQSSQQNNNTSKKVKVDESILTQQDIINCFQSNPVQTVIEMARQLATKLADPQNKQKLAQYVKEMCTIDKSKQLTLLPQYAAQIG